jgi:glycosyltransferase involved in cell wall biosynthesis
LLVNELRVAIVSDYLEEGWPSMDLVADMLVRGLAARRADGLAVTQLRPRFVARFTRVGGAGGAGGNKHLFNADRILNRFIDYPRFLRARRNEFDLFHIVDHSYSQLVPVVGPERSVVTCHDLDTFRCIIEPRSETRSRFYAAMANRVLAGFRRAAAIACVSAATRDQVLRHWLAPAERLTVNPNGVAESFNPRPDPCADRETRRYLGAPDAGTVEILHVGSTISRKRIDALIRVFAALRREVPGVRLIRIGGDFTLLQHELMNQLGLTGDCVCVLPFLSAEVLAAVYRRSAIAVLPSESEGFGLPVIEAQACGTPVVLSDIPVLREIGGPAAAFCAVGDVERWTGAILDLLRERHECPHRWEARVAAGASWAGQFTWANYTEQAVMMYRSIGLG